MADENDPSRGGCSRRDFLRGCGVAALGATMGLNVIGCGGATVANCGPTSLAAGTLDSVTVGGALYIDAAQVFLCRDANGYYALDAECTHVGTVVDFVSSTAGFKCPLHGATYDFNGENPTSPAPRPLRHIAICKTDSGTIVVDSTQDVPAATRLKV